MEMGCFLFCLCLGALILSGLLCVPGKEKKKKIKKINREIPSGARYDRCICCGEPIPEGRQICWKCEHEED